MPHRKVYIPPSLADVGKAVNEVFDRHVHGDPTLADPQVRQGFISFLWMAGRILAKHLSEGEDINNSVDTEEK